MQNTIKTKRGRSSGWKHTVGMVKTRRSFFRFRFWELHVQSKYSLLKQENGKVVKSELESDPITLLIQEPVGEDLEVWNRIKNSGEIAYFIQEGDIAIPGYKKEEREKLRLEIEQIINDYPDSFYAESLRQSMAKFQANEAKRQESLQKIQKQP